jgi:hypothetical protein
MQTRVDVHKTQKRSAGGGVGGALELLPCDQNHASFTSPFGVSS